MVTLPDPKPRHERPDDCHPDVCDGWHTDDAPGMTATELHLLASMERCPAEKRALNRIANRIGVRA